MSSPITSKSDKAKLVGEIIQYYEGEGKTDDWYGATFDKLMSFSKRRLFNLYRYIQKKKFANEIKD